MEYSTKIEESEFSKPYKNTQGYYVSELTSPIIMELPPMKIFNTGKNSKGEYEIQYTIDIENDEFSDLIAELYRLDEYALDSANKNSEHWFGQEISRTVLESLYIPPYDNEESNVFIKLVMTDETFLDKFKRTHNCVIEIKGLEFYRSSFKYLLNIKDVIVHNINEKESKLDFESLIEKSNEVMEELENNEETEPVAELNNNESINNNLDTQTQIVDDNRTEFIDTSSHMSKVEVESMIDQKRVESKRYFINAERASRAAENLKQKAIKKAEELKTYEKILENFN